MADLLPCPFCGGEADFGQQIGGYFVNCVECLASTNVIVDHRLTKQEAADKWNTRALSAPPPAVAPQEFRQNCLDRAETRDKTAKEFDRLQQWEKAAELRGEAIAYREVARSLPTAPGK